MTDRTHCQCEHNFTCGYCLDNRPAYFWTPSTLAEQQQEPATPCRKQRFKSYTFVAPAYWASALINGDLTGLGDDFDDFEAWVAAHPDEARDVVDCDDVSYMGRWNGLLTDLLTYHALRHT